MPAFDDLLKLKKAPLAAPAAVPLRDAPAQSADAALGADLVKGAKPADVKAAQRKVAAVEQLVAKAPEAAPQIIAAEQAKMAEAPKPSRGDRIATALIAVLPTLIGSVAQGAEGGAIGAGVSIDALGGMVKDAKDVEAGAKSAADKARERQDKIDAQERELDDKKLDRASRERIANRDRSSAAQDRLAAMADARTEAGLERFSKRITDSGLEELVGQINEVDRLMPKEGEDIPGFGATGVIPRKLLSEEGKGLRQAVSSIRNAILKARGGSAISEGEADRMLEELGSGISDDDAALRRGIEGVRRTLQAKLTNLEAGTSPEVLGKYKERGGKIGRDSVKAPAASQKPATIMQNGFTYTLNPVTGQYE